MKRSASTVFMALLFASSSSLVLAQQSSEDAFSTQETSPGWSLAEEAEEAEEAEDTRISDPLRDAPLIVGEQQFGWLVVPSAADGDAEALSELEQLSISPSGVRFGGQLYDAKSDNPLEPVSVTLRALDKITAQYRDLVIDMDETAAFGTLAITARSCDTRPPEEFPETTAFLEIVSTESGAEEDLSEEIEAEAAQSQQQAAASDAGLDAPVMEDVSFEADLDAAPAVELPEGTIFSGWMFASSPALNALQHPVYDVWVIDCKMVDPSI